MNKNEYINSLLEKYFEAETSISEEKILRDYFVSSEVTDEHKQYTALFAFFAQEQAKEAPAECLASAKTKRHKLPLKAWIGAAACIIILVVSGLHIARTKPANSMDRSIAYIDGVEVSDKQIIASVALDAVANVSDVDEDAINTQIEILDSFTGFDE